MEENLEITRLVAELERSLINFKNLLGDTPVSRSVNSLFRELKSELAGLADALKKNDREQIIQSARNIASSSQTIGYLAPDLESSDFEVAKEDLHDNAENLLNLVGEPPELLKPLEPIEITSLFTGALGQGNPNRTTRASRDEQEKFDQNFKKNLAENGFRIAGLEQKLNALEATAGNEISKITSAYSDALLEIEGKKTEIDNILGHVSGRAVAGDYEKSATEEKNKADWLRRGSLLCMALIAVSLGYSFWETIGTEFNWQKSLFRITLTFLLSVPAAYLARESAKHREQQYQHLQTSLDLKAISPFLASLPDEEQHKIKIAIASKLFAGRDFSKTSVDPFPLNTQEIIMELLKRLDLSKIQTSKEP
jgi:hypothetical protein